MPVDVFCAIFARGGSKGVPRKNVRPIAGKPLIAWAVQSALSSQYVRRVLVSTDDEEIASVSRSYGAETPFMRPAELSSDVAPEWLAWRHALRWTYEHEPTRSIGAFVSVPTTSVLRIPADIDRCVECLLNSSADLVLTVAPSSRNPYFNMVELDANGSARMVMRNKSVVDRRQVAPDVYDITTVCYAARPEYVLSAPSMFAGDVRAVIVPAERALDIDTEMDFEISEYFLRKRCESAGVL